MDLVLRKKMIAREERLMRVMSTLTRNRQIAVKDKDKALVQWFDINLNATAEQLLLTRIALGYEKAN